MAEGLNSPRSAQKDENIGNMPNGDTENMDIDHQNPVDVVGGGEQQMNETEPSQERNITQTDHINKSLLTSFLSHLNNPSESLQYPHVPSISTVADDDDGPGSQEQELKNGAEWK